ncbi:19613_t:CDS:2 [Funneliformis geosporum]|uniref:19613_t:CDS:1 n=1 Tax=Funneliformis geosporum TaxID=1117311 RepID=A0A9W4WLD5_9GLOM|nr:19613_t:CDS:2 [Funneliformis geosporum]
MNFEFEDEMNDIFDDKENTSDIEVEIKKETKQLERKPKSKKSKFNTTTAIDLGNNMIEILLR